MLIVGLMTEQNDYFVRMVALLKPHFPYGTGCWEFPPDHDLHFLGPDGYDLHRCPNCAVRTYSVRTDRLWVDVGGECRFKHEKDAMFFKMLVT